MGNQRNHKFRHISRGKFARRKTPTTTTVLPPPTQPVTIEGSRIINIAKLQEYIIELSIHSTQCGGSVILTGEERDGLASIISTQCSRCHHTITLETAKKVKGPRGYRRWECNLAAVWGQMATGGGHTQLQETMSTLGVPVMTKRNFV